MRPLSPVNIDDVNEGDMITFQRTTKDGTEVSQLAFVSRVNLSEDQTTIDNFELLPMVPLKEAQKLGNMKTVVISDERDLQYSGLDIPFTIYGMGIVVTPNDFPQGTTQKLGYLHESIADRLYDFADHAEKEEKRYFNLRPNQLSGINFPPLKIQPPKPRPFERARDTGIGIAAEAKKTAGYDYIPVESGGKQPYIEGNPWQDFDFK